MEPFTLPLQGAEHRAEPFAGWSEATQTTLMNSVALGTTVAAASAGMWMGIGWAMAGRFALPALPPTSPLRTKRASAAERQPDSAPAGEANARASETQAQPVSERAPKPNMGAESTAIETPARSAPGGVSAESAGMVEANASESEGQRHDLDVVEQAVAVMPLDMSFARETGVPFVHEANASSVDALLSSAAVPPAFMTDAHRPAGLDAPRGGVADDLTRIVGIGPKLERALNELGIHHFDQIAGWTDEDVAWVNRHLRRKGRVKDEDWRAQAETLVSAEGVHG